MSLKQEKDKAEEAQAYKPIVFKRTNLLHGVSSPAKDAKRRDYNSTDEIKNEHDLTARETDKFIAIKDQKGQTAKFDSRHFKKNRFGQIIGFAEYFAGTMFLSTVGTAAKNTTEGREQKNAIEFKRPRRKIAFERKSEHVFEPVTANRNQALPQQAERKRRHGLTNG
jgi:hypothetical protein